MIFRGMQTFSEFLTAHEKIATKHSCQQAYESGNEWFD
jgi:hypothetical protein